MKIATRMIIQIAAISAILIIALVAYISIEITKIQEKNINAELMNTAYRYANQIDADLEAQMSVVRTMSNLLGHIKTVPAANRRNYIQNQLKTVLEKNPDFIGIWTCWEPNELDGLDKKFVNKTGHDKTGRFIPFIFTNDKNIQTEPLKNYDVEVTGDYYLMAKKTNIESIANPFEYVHGTKKIWVTSMSVPINIDGKFVGAVGVHISLQQITDSLIGFHPYTDGYGVLIANNGIRAAHQKTDLVGKSLYDKTPEDLKESLSNAIKTGKEYTYTRASSVTGIKSLYYHVPIAVGKTSTPWSFLITVPEATVFGTVTKIKEILLTAAIFSVFIISFLVWLIGRNIGKSINTMLTEVRKLIEAGTNGNLKYRADIYNIHPEFQPVLLGINEVLDTVISPLNTASSLVERISNGDLSVKITEDYKGDFNVLKNNLNQCIDNLNGLINEMNETSKIQMAGDFEKHADETKFDGSYKTLISGFNKGMQIHIDNILGMLDLLKEYSEGNLSKPMPVLPGKQILATQVINMLRDNVQNLISDTNKLSLAAFEGNLSYRADASKHKGDYQRIIDGINDTLNAVVLPLNVAANCIDRISKGDIPEKITDHYNGDFNRIIINLNQLITSFKLITSNVSEFGKGNLEIEFRKRSDKDELMETLSNLVNINKNVINDFKRIADGDLTTTIKPRSNNDEMLITLTEMIRKLNTIVSQVMEATENVASGSQQLSNTATSIAQGANEQATSTEEISASIEEMSSIIQQNMENALQTEKIAKDSVDGIQRVNKSSEDSLNAMREIADKITIINDIAEKTDILAINAAIEAARAGEHGKGFAVVAAEVRKLAEISQQAAKEINQLSKQSLRITEESSKLLTGMIPNIQRTAQLVQEISAASSEQSGGANQIIKAIEQLNQVTQQNSAAAEEMSTGSEELSSQAETLKDAIGYFNIGKQILASKHFTQQQKPVTRKNNYSKGVELSLTEEVLDNEYRRF